MTMEFAHPARMGLRARDLAAWLAPQPGDDALLSQRRRLLAEVPDEVLCVLPEGREAAAELCTVLRAPGLAEIGGALAEDICVLTPHDDLYRLTAGVLCFPNRWRLRDKVGKPLIAIHAPVPDYEGKLARSVEKFLAGLAPMRLFQRDNWGLTDRADLYLPESGPPVWPGESEGIFVREEYQSFVKLPATHAVVFSIRTVVRPWTTLSVDEQRAVSGAAAALSPAWRAYKSLAPRPGDTLHVRGVDVDAPNKSGHDGE